mmetsp:Transcript_19649/g.27086  ORF Transcript_19649/g.27086 Transcript_19649/m.27086 type:complete len:355 (+) Transcript_19649:54-1118(+)
MGEVPRPSLEGLLDAKAPKWIFVGGKGGVGKTTTSCALSCLLAWTPLRNEESKESRKRRVLIISTDPAHNLSDAFGQPFSKTPTAVKGLENLHAIEIDPSALTKDKDYFADWHSKENDSVDSTQGTFRNLFGVLQNAAASFPGIDEVTVFAELMREVQQLNYDTVVFDTAPTGHTLRLLALPHTLADALDRLLDLQGMTTLLNAASQFMGNATDMSAGTFTEKVQHWRGQIKEIQQRFTNHEETTFVCVCIPEFLSVYETERLIQELAKYDIACDHVVVNQLVRRPKNESPCRMCDARVRIQSKYLEEITELYEDFHIVQMPLMCDEVRGVESLSLFGKYLLTPYNPDRDGYLM